VDVFGSRAGISRREKEMKEGCEGSDLATSSTEGEARCETDSDTETTRITIEDDESKIDNEDMERDMLRGYRHSTETEER
jgi:hypothetical protein